MLKVLTGCVDASLINATSVLESSPPDRNAPIGTSAISWLATTLRKAARSAPIASSSLHARIGTSAASQYRCTVTSPSR